MSESEMARPTPSRLQRQIQQPTIGVKLIPKNILFPNFPGHMGITWKLAGSRSFRGFRFNADDLPLEYRSPSRWRDYLFDHRVRGLVVNDVILQDTLMKMPEKVLCKQWIVNSVEVSEIDANTPIGPYGWYSFDPDPPTGSHNCVTWTIEVVNRVLHNVLQPVRKGRIRLAIEMLSNMGAKPSA
jgi:hypothetical protein